MTHYLSINESQVNPLEVDEAAAASVLVGVIPAPPPSQLVRMMGLGTEGTVLIVWDRSTCRPCDGCFRPWSLA